MTWDVCPAADLITQAFGCTDFPGEWLVDVSVCDSRRFHAGIDLGSSQGGWAIYQTPVYATRPGTVVAVGVAYLGPFAVTVQYDDGIYVEHGHLDSAAVAKGDPVVPGTLLGRLGTQGSSTAPHLHVEARIDGPRQGNPDRYTVDPKPYLNSGVDDVTPDELRQAIRDVLNEGTVAGTNGWAQTSQETGRKVDALFHQLAEAVAQGQTDAKGTVLDTHDKVDKVYHALLDATGALATLAAVKTELDAIKASGVGADPAVKTLLDRFNQHFK